MKKFLIALATATIGLFLSFGVLVTSPAAAAQCFWMSNQAGNPWVPAPQGAISREECFRLDSCSGGQKASGGGCFKWAASASAAPMPWPGQSFAGKAAAGCGQPTDRACWQSAVTAAVNACKASGCGTCTTPASASDNCRFEGGYTCNSICK